MTGWRGPDELLAVLGQSIPGAADRGGVCVAPGVAPPGSGHHLCHGAGLDLAGAAAEVGGVGRAVGPPTRAASASGRSVGRHLAPRRRGRRGRSRLTRAAMGRKRACAVCATGVVSLQASQQTLQGVS